MIDANQSIASVVLAEPATGSVFQRHAIDFCTFGTETVAERCRALGLDVGGLIAELEEACVYSDTGEPLSPGSIMELMSEIVATHHEWTRRSLRDLLRTAIKVEQQHPSHGAKLGLLIGAIEQTDELVRWHLAREERELFPALLEKASRRHDIAHELTCMRDEHFLLLGGLRRIRVAADGFVAPPWACHTYRELLASLLSLEIRAQRAIHFESFALMPRLIVAQGAQGAQGARPPRSRP